ncbi:MAG: HD domain-containing phosphohydrolase [Actinomycetota bacterium]
MATSEPEASDRLRLAELLAALSLVADLGMSFPPEHAARISLLATGLARAMDLPDDDVASVYWTALMKHVGCTAYAHELAALAGGDDIATLAGAATVDFAKPREAMGYMAGLGRGLPGFRRARVVATAMAGSRRWGREFETSFCEVGAGMARRLGLGPSVERGLFEILERWDGKGGPSGRRGDDVALAARFAQVAEQAILFDGRGGREAALAAVRERAGGWLDPAICDAFARHGLALLNEIEASDPLSGAVDVEPEPRRWIAVGQLDDVARTFGDAADMKSPFFRGHSAGVARVAEAAAVELGLPEAEALSLRRGGFLHDLGRVGIPTGTWERPGALTAAEWEGVRLHAYHSERVLSRSAVLAPLAPLVGMHHERQDGSGYHRGASGGAIPSPARVLAAADAFVAMTEERAHRPAMPPDAAARELEREASAGRLDPDAVRAVLRAAGHQPRAVRREWPAGLSEREVEVLDLVARGLSTRDVAARLFISPRTVEHHIGHIYAKLGVSSRAALAMFAMEHDLLAR